MILTDKDFGTITVTVNPRARRIIMRAEVDGLRVTAPRYAARNDILSAIEKFREPLLRRQQEAKERPRHTPLEVEQLRIKAKMLFPRRVAELAYMHGFTYTRLRIQSSRTRWGSCSSTGNINLSLFLADVPEHLQDYVILHELCHTVHHDHSPAFWTLLDK